MSFLNFSRLRTSSISLSFYNFSDWLLVCTIFNNNKLEDKVSIRTKWRWLQNHAYNSVVIWEKKLHLDSYTFCWIQVIRAVLCWPFWSIFFEIIFIFLVWRRNKTYLVQSSIHKIMKERYIFIKKILGGHSWQDIEISHSNLDLIKTRFYKDS